MIRAPVCSIVGFGPGLSRAIAERFAREGFALALLARTPDTLDRAAHELSRTGPGAHAFPADAWDTTVLAAALDAVERRVGPTEVLIYNAAVMEPCRPSKLKPEHLLKELRVGVASALAAAQQVLPAMRARGRGTLLFTGGGLALTPWMDVASLSIQKAGLRTLAITLAQELTPEGIHAATVTICGPIQAGTFFDPARIAELYWELHQDPPGRFRHEVVVKPAA